FGTWSLSGSYDGQAFGLVNLPIGISAAALESALNGAVSQFTPGALDNVHGNNNWASNVTLGSVNPDGRDVTIGAESNGGIPTQFTISGVINSQPSLLTPPDNNGVVDLTKRRSGKVIFNNSNTYNGPTIVIA